METPRPTVPVCGTQNMVCSSVAPQNFSFSPGPGTLVITAVVLRPNRLSIASCAGLISRPATDSRPKVSSGCRLPLSAFMRARTAYTRSIGLAMPTGSTSGIRPKRLPSFQASSIGRRLIGTIARISLPAGSSPWWRR